MSIAFLLVLIPTIAGALSFIIMSHAIRRTLLVLTAVLHFGITISTWFIHQAEYRDQWLYLDSLGIFFLTVTSLLFLLASIYALAYLKEESLHHKQPSEKGFIFTNIPEAGFSGCLLLFLSSMTLVIVSQHFGVLWIAMEATTLASAPLIYFHRYRKSLEATWKYLLICSVGIALALLGNVFLDIASFEEGTPFLVANWIRQGPALNAAWLKVAFIFFFVGYGTKMGIAPMHTWLPDAHSEAPSLVSALLSGSLLNCAFLALLRVYQVCVAANITSFIQPIFLIFGILSLIIAAFFIIKQKDFKRMLAYSSIEHMGILCLGMGLGGVAIFGTLFHILNHSLTKGALFLLSGNIMAYYKTKIIGEVEGVLKALPSSGVLWILGFLAITGTPPFGMFFSKFIILKAAFDLGHVWVALLFLIFLVLIFIGLAISFMRMSLGKDKPTGGIRRSSYTFILGPAILIGLELALGFYLFPFLSQIFGEISHLLGGP